MKSKLCLLGLCILGFFAAFGCQSPTPTAEFHKYKDAADVPRISVADAKKEVDAGTAIIVDSRGDVAYNVEHVAGSIPISLGGPADDHKFDPLPKGKKIIVYCS